MWSFSFVVKMQRTDSKLGTKTSWLGLGKDLCLS